MRFKVVHNMTNKLFFQENEKYMRENNGKIFLI